MITFLKTDTFKNLSLFTLMLFGGLIFVVIYGLLFFKLDLFGLFITKQKESAFILIAETLILFGLLAMLADYSRYYLFTFINYFVKYKRLEVLLLKYKPFATSFWILLMLLGGGIFIYKYLLVIS